MAVASPPRRKRVRLEDVARKVKISIGTASMAVRGSTRISARTRQRVLEACRDLGYRRPRSATVAVNRQRVEPTVALLLVGNSVHDLINAELLHVLSSAAHVQHFRLEVQTIESPADDDRALTQQIISIAQRCAGVLLSGNVSHEALHALDEAHLRAALLGWPIVDPADDRWETHPPGVIIAGHDQAMGRFATRRLIRAGCRRIAFIAGQMPAGASHAKWLEGYRLALADAGLAFDGDLVRVTGSADEPATEAARALASMDDPADGYVVTEARVAGLLQRELERLGQTDAGKAMIVWTNQPQARMYGIGDAMMVSIDTDQWVQAALAHVLCPQHAALPVGSRVLVPFITRHVEVNT